MKKRIMIIMGMGMLWCSLPVQAQVPNTTQCSFGNNVPPVYVTATEQSIKTVFTKNRAELNQLGAQVLASQGATSNTHVGGLADGVITSNMEIGYQTTSNNRGVGCVKVEKIIVKLDYSPTIYISKEYNLGSCYHRAVMNHEMKHVNVDRAIIAAYTNRIRTLLEQAVRQAGAAGPMEAAEFGPATEKMKTVIGGYLDKVLAAMKAERELQQSAVDSPDEYARVQAECRNWP